MATHFKKVLIYFFFLNLFTANAQFNPEKKAINKIKKGQWNSARKILNKSLRKDSLNIEALYSYSVLYFTPHYSRFNVDTANYYRFKTSNLFANADNKLQERLKKFPLDSTVLANQKNKIDSAAFEKAKNIDTEDSYIHFLSHYPGANQTQQAIELRDEAAFVIALKGNTHFAFQNFLDKYPNSHRTQEAQDRYDKLLYSYETQNKTLEEFERFVNQYPASPFRSNAIQNIYEKTTLDGSEQSFESFINLYPENKMAKEASNILLHIRLSKQSPVTMTDSLKALYPLLDWIPITDNNKWGFMDHHGEIVFDTILDEIDEEYFCNPMHDDFIKTKNEIISRNGATIAKGKFKSTTDIGYGFIRAETDSSILLIHKSGKFLPIRGLTDAFIIGSQFIAAKNSNQWGIFSFTGFAIIPFTFERIIVRGQSVIMSKAGKEILLDINKIIPYSQGKEEPIVADEIKHYGSKYLWIRNGALEEIIDTDLNKIIPFDRHQITFESIGLVQHKNNYHYLKNWPMLESTPLETYQIFEPWLVTRKTGERPSLHYIPKQQTIAELADSIWFDQALAAVMKSDSVRLIQSPTRFFTIPMDENYSVRQSRDSIAFILVKSKNKTNIHLASTFERITTTTWQGVEPILKNIFLIKEKGKQGLIDDKNKILLNPEYDALLYTNGVFTLLKDRKFGTYNPTTKKLLKPAFESNLIKYNQEWTIGRKENKLAFINPETKNPVFEFDEINFWTDSVALVKVNGKKALYSIFNKKIIMDNIGTFQIVNEFNNRRFAILSQGNLLGVIGGESETILKPEFEELTFQRVNDTLVFIAMKPLPGKEVEIFYFDRDGKTIKKLKTDIDTGYDIICDN